MGYAWPELNVQAADCVFKLQMDQSHDCLKWFCFTGPIAKDPGLLKIHTITGTNIKKIKHLSLFLQIILELKHLFGILQWYGDSKYSLLFWRQRVVH